MSFRTIASNRNMKKEQNYVTQIQTALWSILKYKTFAKTLQMTLKRYLMLPVMNEKDHHLNEKIKKIYWNNEDQLGGK